MSPSFPGRFAKVCLQRVKVDQTDQLVKAAIAQVWALDIAMDALLFHILMNVLISFVKQGLDGAHLGTFVGGLWFQEKGVRGGRRGAEFQKKAQVRATPHGFTL